MKNVLVLSSFPAPYRVAVFNELKKLYKMDVFFLLSKDDNRNEKYFADKKKFDFHLYSDVEDQRFLKQCVSNLKHYDMVLAYDWYLPEALKIVLKCILLGVPYVVNCDGAFINNSFSVKQILKERFKAFVIKYAKACLAGSDSAITYFKHYGAKENRIYHHKFTSLHKTDIAQRLVSAEDKNKLRDELNLPSCRMVLSVGQFIYRKGYDILLNAWKELDKDYQLVIIGGGNLRSEYESIIRENGYRNVTLVGFVEPTKLTQYYKAADLFVLPTREDVWGLVINEAMAYGLPVVSTDRCQSAVELIDSDFIVSVEDIKKIKEKMLELISDDKRMEYIGNRNLIKISEYTIENIARDHIEVFSRLGI